MAQTEIEKKILRTRRTWSVVRLVLGVFLAPIMGAIMGLLTLILRELIAGTPINGLSFVFSDWTLSLLIGGAFFGAGLQSILGSIFMEKVGRALFRSKMVLESKSTKRYDALGTCLGALVGVSTMIILPIITVYGTLEPLLILYGTIAGLFMSLLFLIFWGAEIRQVRKLQHALVQPVRIDDIEVKSNEPSKPGLSQYAAS